MQKPARERGRNAQVGCYALAHAQASTSEDASEAVSASDVSGWCQIGRLTVVIAAMYKVTAKSVPLALFLLGLGHFWH